MTELKKKTETNARRRIAESWHRVGSSKKYRRAAMREAYFSILSEIKEELFDGIFISLSPRYDNKSRMQQKRVVRRIVEKRQAQAAFKLYGHTENLQYAHEAASYSKRCVRNLHRYCNCI